VGRDINGVDAPGL